MPVRYEVNDDFEFINILSGKGGFAADFSSTTQSLSQFLSYTLYFLYDRFPSIPWYGLTIYLSAYLGISLITSVLLRNTRDKLSLILCIPALLVYFSHCFSVITYTSAVLLLEFGVFLSLMEWVLKIDFLFKRNRLFGFFLGACFLFSFLIRWQIVLYFMLFGVPVLFYIKKQHLKAILPVIAVLLLFILGDRMLFKLNTTPGHKSYYEYTQLRRGFNDTVKGEYNGETTLKALKKAGWNMEDYAFFRSWILYDDRLFNTEALKTFLQANSPYQEKKYLKVVWSKIKSRFNSSKLHTLVLIFTISALFLLRIHNFTGLSNRQKFRLILSILIIFAGILFLMYYRFPYKVFIPLYAYTISVFVLLTSNNTQTFYSKRIIPVIIALLLFLPVLVHSYTIGRMELGLLESSRQEKDYIKYSLNYVKDNHAHPPLLVLMDPVFSGGLGTEKVHPLKEFSDYTSLRVFPWGGEINSPRYASILKQMGLKNGREFLKWSINREDVLFVHFVRSEKSLQKHAYLWESYFNRHISPDRKIKLQAVYDFRNKYGTGLIFYRMKVSQSY